MLFQEMWSNDDEGFPIPEGCYYGKTHRDKTEDGVASHEWREFIILFKKGNGLKHACTATTTSMKDMGGGSLQRVTETKKGEDCEI
jgi:hypothetical protein